MTADLLEPARGRGIGPRMPWMLGAAALALYAALLASPYELRILTLAAIQALLVLGYQFIFGHAGALSLAQGAFFGLGAYVTGIFGGRYGLGFLATFPLSVLIPTALAALIALPVLRLASHYFALATLGLAQVVLLAAVNGGNFTGGALGLTGVPGIMVFGWTVPRGLPFLTVVAALLGLGALVAARLTHGLTGRAYGVLRGAPLAAGAMGLDEGRLRFAAFLLSAAYAGAAGALQAHTLRVVSSEVLEFPVMITCLAMTVIGGGTRIAGAFLGALLLVHLPEWLRALAGYALLAYGAALLAAIVLAPEGLAGLAAKLLRRWNAPPSLFPPMRPAAAHRGTASAPSPLLEARGLVKRFGGIEALRGVDLRIEAGETLGIIGPNGSGKTTLANLMTGLAASDSGSIRLGRERIDGEDAAAIARAGIARSFQTPALPGDLRAIDTVAVARAAHRDAIGIGAALAGTDKGATRAQIEAEAFLLLMGVGAAASAHLRGDALPPATARRVEIARALALEPRLLILDEPAAGLGESDHAALASLLEGLAADGMALLIIEHNMPFLLPIADRVIVLDQGRVIAEGAPADIQRDPAVIAAYLGRAAEARR